MTENYYVPLFGNESNSSGEEHGFMGLEGAAAQGLAAGLTTGCVLGAGLASGLNLCLLSLDPSSVTATATNPSLPEDVRNAAKKVAAILDHQHWMLVTTLIWNALFVESMPLIIETLVGSGIAAVAMSTVLTVIFGEIIPQSSFARYALTVAGFLSPVVWIMMIVSAPISVPIAKLLDCIIGHRPATAMKRGELRTLIALNVMAKKAGKSKRGDRRNNNNNNSDSDSESSDYNDEYNRSQKKLKNSRGDFNNDASYSSEDVGLLKGAKSIGGGGGGTSGGDEKNNKKSAAAVGVPPRSSTAGMLSGSFDGVQFSKDELALLNGALNLSEKTVRDVMSKEEFVEKLFMLEENDLLSKETVTEIVKSNKTRIPVYQQSRRNIVGFIFSHALLHIIFMDEKTQAPRVKDCGVTQGCRCNASDLVVVLFQPFLADAQDMAVVCDDQTGLPIGIVTKWDMLSFLFNDDIGAETWNAHEAEVLAIQMLTAQRQRAKRETVLLSSSHAVSQSIKSVSASDLHGISNSSFSGDPYSAVSASASNSLGAPNAQHAATAAAGGASGSGGYGTVSGDHLVATTSGVGGTLHAGGSRGSTSGSAYLKSGSQAYSRSGSIGGGGRRASHFTPGDTQRKQPNFGK